MLGNFGEYMHNDIQSLLNDSNIGIICIRFDENNDSGASECWLEAFKMMIHCADVVFCKILALEICDHQSSNWFNNSVMLPSIQII